MELPSLRPSSPVGCECRLIASSHRGAAHLAVRGFYMTVSHVLTFPKIPAFALKTILLSLFKKETGAVSLFLREQKDCF